MKTENQTAAKQEYQTPELSELGSLAELTLVGVANNSDANTTSAS